MDFISKKYQPEIHTVVTSLILIFNMGFSNGHNFFIKDGLRRKPGNQNLE